MASASRQVRSSLRLARHALPSRLLAATIACSFAIAPFNVEATMAAAQDSEIERLYVEGQDKYSAGDFSGAADAWTRLLARLPEAQANRATRENVLLNVLQAHLDGYARARRDDGTKDVSHLHRAKEVLDQYFSDFKAAYGPSAGVSAAVQEKADELDRTLADAEPKPEEIEKDPEETEKDPEETEKDPDEKTGPSIVVLENENDGGGLIVGGAVTAGLSLAGFGLLAAGAVIAKRAQDDYVAAPSGDSGNDAREDAEDRGSTGNALTITGAIVGPMLLITGGVLIGLGIKKRRDSKAARDEQIRSLSVMPTAGRGFGGMVIQGRF